ncbi:hypothetical protein BaRGS_00000922 [Batillaria attramentaria]|uniref:Amine oxidase domain-containing protein n=1 Tax=Batillaria attramentaria TaxID=370345 RepID=A0ABD0M9A6_9CAEN
MVKVLVVGSGMTGCAAAALLRQRLPPDTDITIWDKARGAGGRMSTSRSSAVKIGPCTADLGAQYITLTAQYQPKRQQLYSDLVAEGILAPMVAGSIEGPNRFDQDGAKHFVTPKGSSSLVKRYLEKSKANVEYDREIVSVEVKDPDSITVVDTRGAGADFNAVVLTMPVPQILQLKGSINKALDSQRSVWEKLQAVNYSSRFALGLFYEPGTELPYPWSVKYLDNNPCIRFVAIDSKKRGLDGKNVSPSVVVHTHVQFGLQHVDENKEEVKDVILSHLKECLPDLPPPAEVKSQKWRYSQVHRGYPGSPGCLTLQQQPLLVLAGDAFTLSTFDGCLDSAEAAANTVTDYFKSGKL